MDRPNFQTRERIYPVVGTQLLASESYTDPDAQDIVTSSLFAWPDPQPIASASDGEMARARVARSILVFIGLSIKSVLFEQASTLLAVVKDKLLGRVESDYQVFPKTRSKIVSTCLV